MSRIGTITRRTLLVGVAAIAGGAAYGYWQARKPWPNPLGPELAEGEVTLNAWLKIAPDNTITVYAPRAEMGQGISTSLAALVAEELNVPVAMLKVEHGPNSGAYYNSAMLEEGGPHAQFDDSTMAEVMRTVSAGLGRVLGLQVTGGSSSIRDGFDKMRLAGAAARHALTAAAAAELGVAADTLVCADGRITDPASGKTLEFGSLAAASAMIEAPAGLTLKPKSEWTILGKPQKRVDTLAKVTGAPIFGVDVNLPDMLHATVRMNPRLGAPYSEAVLEAAMAVKGVEQIVELKTQTGHGFGVIASNTWAAFKGAEAIEVEWGAAAYPADSAGIDAVLEAALASDGGSALLDEGDVDAAITAAPAGSVIEAAYSAPFVAHACMEPMNATAQFADGRLTIWAPNQAPTIIATVCAGALGIETDAVTVHTTHLGGGFGRRGEVDFALYAALLAKETGGRPVKVTWTREEDMRHDMYRPAARGRFRAVLGTDGMPTALDMRIATPSILKSVIGRTFPSLPAGGPERLLTEGAFDQPLTIANHRVTGVPAELGIPVGFWRSVGNSFNGFFHEGFLDELAVAGGVDPVAQRLALMKDHPTAMKVVERVAEMASWSAPKTAGRAKGFAFTLSFGGWVGQIVEVSGPADAISIENVWCAADIGTVIDPLIAERQIISGIVYGLSAAMSQKITFADGMVEQENFFDHDAMRIDQCPAFHVALLENAEKLGGVGEIGTPPSIPALGNAIFALTGKRLRSMPFAPDVSFA
jgi:isoquinoline 1-oxidoreductase subunit beta